MDETFIQLARALAFYRKLKVRRTRKRGQRAFQPRIHCCNVEFLARAHRTGFVGTARAHAAAALRCMRAATRDSCLRISAR